MAYVANIVTVAEMQFYAGENVDATGDADANHTILQDHAEAYLSCLLKYELSAANWALLNATTKIIITEWAARYAATQLILYNPAEYSTIVEAEDMVNVHLFRMRQIEKLLEADGVLHFMGVD